MTPRHHRWEAAWPEYRVSSDPGGSRYRRGQDRRWRYGPRDTSNAELPVPGAVDFRLGDLVSPSMGERLRRPPDKRSGPWDDGLPYGLGPEDLCLSAGLVHRTIELAQFREGRTTPGWASGRQVVIIDSGHWQAVEGRVIGMRAPELCPTGFARPLAGAERDLRRVRRDRDRLVVRRRTLLVAAHRAGIEAYKIAGALSLTRARVHQLLSAATDASLPDDLPGPHPLQTLRAVHQDLQRADELLLAGERTRRRRVHRANREMGMGLGEIAAILDTSRSRAQQLRDQHEATA